MNRTIARVIVSLSLLVFCISLSSAQGGFGPGGPGSMCWHNYVAETLQEATCLETGIQLQVCSRCNDSITSEIKALGHDYQASGAAATCTSSGHLEYQCKRCSDHYAEDQDPLGHNIVKSVVEPTTVNEGCTLYQCSRCSYNYKEDIVPKIDPSTYFTQLRFSEVMPCNISTYINTDTYNFAGFVEFFNGASYSVNLKDCVLSHYKLSSKGKYSLKWQWQISNDLPIKGSSYDIVWMDETDKTKHAPFKLDADGGYLTLYSGDMLIDSIAYGPLDAHISYGRYGNTVGYMNATPYQENTLAVADRVADRCQIPTFSQKPGVLTSSTTVSLQCATSTAVIYYTLDGTEPSESNGLVYSQPLTVDENTNIRARAYQSGKIPSKIATASYLFEDAKHSKCGGFTVPIVSITIDELYYDDPMYGMFVRGSNGVSGEKSCQMEVANYNHDEWKRPLNFEYIVDGQQVVSQEVEAAIEGGCSRNSAIKSISLKTSKRTGKSQYDYHFFESKPEVFHQTLHLRNGGSGYSCVPFRDGLMQTFAHGMNIDYQAYQPVAYYMNGSYIGMMALNERTNSDYVKANYGYDEDEIDVITVSDQLGISASKGTMEAYDELVSYLNDNDPNSPNYFKGACERMDMDEYLDYQVFQQFIVNGDWPGNNTKIWRLKKNGLFRWILFDTDYGMSLCYQGAQFSSSMNMIEWCQGKNASWANKYEWMVNIFKPLSQNEEFKKRFVTKFLINLQDRFSKENIEAVFDSITSLVSAEYCAYKSTDAVNETSSMRKFALERPANIYKHLTSYVGGKSAVDLKITSNVKASFSLNGETFSSFEGKYIAGYDFDLYVYAPMGYVFDHWEISEEKNLNATQKSEAVGTSFLPGRLSGTLSGAVTLNAVFTKSSSEMPTLVINEVCSSSDAQSGNADDYNSYPDWIELYNYGTKAIDLSGFYLTNSKNDALSTLPLNANEELVIAAGGHKLLWAKGENRLGANYLNFKLDNDKRSTICLSYSDGASEIMVDCVEYETHPTNGSYGRVTDNNEAWTIFDLCSTSLALAATPNKANGSACGLTDVEEALEIPSGISLYPNPAKEYLMIVTNEKVAGYSIYSANGSLLERRLGDVSRISLDGYASGFYVIEVQTADNNYREKFVIQ